MAATRHVTAEGLFNGRERTGRKRIFGNGLQHVAGFLRSRPYERDHGWMVRNPIFDTCTDDHPHFFWEDTQDLSDAPASELEIARLPAAPEGAEIARAGRNYPGAPAANARCRWLISQRYELQIA